VSNAFSVIVKPGQSGLNSKFSKEIYLTGACPVTFFEENKRSVPARLA